MSVPPAVEESANISVDQPPLSSNETFLKTGLGDLATRACFLSLFIIIGFVGNCVLVATIAQSNRLKGFMLNLFIISVAVFNLINCIVNMPLILGNTITEKWDYGDFLCRFNAFTLQLASIGMIFGLLLMTADRFLAIRYSAWYEAKFSVLKSNILIVYTWLHAFGLSVPLIFGVIPVKAFPARYLCAVDSGASVIYLAVRSICGYLIPSLIIFVFLLVILKIAIQEKMRQKNDDNAPSRDSNSRIWLELSAAKYVFVLVLLWCVCEAPYIILTSIEQFTNSVQVKESDIDINYHYPWEVELSFTWLKLSYAIVLPIVTFFWRKDVWQKFKNCVLCKKSNLIVDASPKRKSHLYQENDIGITQADKSNGSIPVLFATPEGLHFQTFTNDIDETSFSEKTKQATDSPMVEINPNSQKCDVFGSQHYLEHDEADTSDYDSEIDPFSGSNPISVHTKSSFENDNLAFNGESEKTAVPCTELIKQDTITSTKVFEEDQPQPDVFINEDAPHDDKFDHDSGRGSYGENSLKKNQKKKKRRVLKAKADESVIKAEEPITDSSTDKPLDTHNEKISEEEQEQIPVISEDGYVKRKKKRRRNKEQVEAPIAYDRSLPALRRPAPARLGPLDSLPDEDVQKDKRYSKDSSAKYHLQSEHMSKVENSEDVSLDNISKSSQPTPKPAPRKSLMKGDSVQKATKKKSILSNNNSDSQKNLLMDSSTSNDMSSTSDTINRHN